MALTTPRYPDLWILNPVKCFPTLNPKVKTEFWTTEIALMVSHNHILPPKDVVPNNRIHPHPSHCRNSRRRNSENGESRKRRHTRDMPRYRRRLGHPTF
jgi:hypothetical protein